MKLKKSCEHFKFASNLVGPLKCFWIFGGIIKRLVKVRYLDDSSTFKFDNGIEYIFMGIISFFIDTSSCNLRVCMNNKSVVQLSNIHGWSQVRHYAHPGKSAWTIIVMLQVIVAGQYRGPF
jgi:hypothetical protein